MKVAVDANVLVRAVVRDDPAQADVAAAVLTDAGLIAVALPCLCEFVWVLLRVYGFQQAEAGGDFADGVIAYEGHWLGGETFVSFFYTSNPSARNLPWARLCPSAAALPSQRRPRP